MVARAWFIALHTAHAARGARSPSKGPPPARLPGSPELPHSTVAGARTTGTPKSFVIFDMGIDFGHTGTAMMRSLHSDVGLAVFLLSRWRWLRWLFGRWRFRSLRRSEQRALSLPMAQIKRATACCHPRRSRSWLPSRGTGGPGWIRRPRTRGGGSDGSPTSPAATSASRSRSSSTIGS